MFELLRAAWEVVPGVYDLSVVESVAGLRPGSRDDAPILGETPIEGLIMATGHYRKGILLAPLTALSIAEVILERRTPALIRPFGLTDLDYKPMQLTVNGQEQSVDDASTLLDLLIEMNFNAEQKGIAVALNAEVVARAMWADTRLCHGDRVDIIHAVQGG